MAGQTDGEFKSECLSSQSQARNCLKMCLRFPRKEEVVSPVWTQEGALLYCSKSCTGQSQVTTGVGDTECFSSMGCFFRKICFVCPSCHIVQAWGQCAGNMPAFQHKVEGFFPSSKISAGKCFPDGHTTACRFCQYWPQNSPLCP